MQGNKSESLNFDQWNELKQKINFNRQAPYFKIREVWWTSIGHNIGFEQNGRNDMFERPVLITKKFNNYVFLGLPLTGKHKQGKYYFPINIDGRDTSVIISQIRLFDAKRLIRKMSVLEKETFTRIHKEFYNNL